MQDINTELNKDAMDPGVIEENPLASLSVEEQELIMEALEAAEKKAREEREQLLETLAHDIEGKFKTRMSKRGVKEAQWLQALRLYLGSVASRTDLINPDNPYQVTPVDRRPEFNIVRTKCSVAIAQSISMQFSGGDKNWDLEVSPDPKDPLGNPMPVAEAQVACQAMEKVIEDQLLNCEYGAQSRLAIQDRVILGTGILKGPINALHNRKKYRAVGAGGNGNIVMQAQIEQINEPSVVRVNPWFFFPDDTVIDISMATDAIEVHPMSAAKLASLANSPQSGFSEYKDVIFEILKSPPKDWSSGESFTQFTALTAMQETFKNKYSVLEYHGPIEKTTLDTLGVEPTYESPNSIYHGEVWVCNGKVIRLQLAYTDGCYEVPYCVCPWEADPASIFGIGVPIMVADQQLVINETYKMLLDNCAVSSGPQVVMHRDLIEPADARGHPSDWYLKPNKVWFYKDFGDTDVKKAVEFFTPDNTTESLMNVINLARQLAEEESEVPLMQAGLMSNQVVQSATGAQIQSQSSTVVIEYKNEMWDDQITSKVIRWIHDWNWENNTSRPEIFGDFEIDVKSSSEYRARQIHITNLEKLSVEASQNPTMGDIIKMHNLAKSRLALMQLPTADIVKSEEEIAKDLEAKSQQPDPVMMELEIKKQQADVAAGKLELERQRLEFEYQVQQQREAWEHEEKMSANYARIQESYAQVIAEETRRQTELIKLAQSEKTEAAWVMTELKKASMQDSREKFLAGLDYASKLREQMLAKEEIKLKKQTGSGALSTV